MALRTPGEPEHLPAREDGADRQTRVFISYSRKDLAFAEALVASLIARGFEAYLDKKDILPGEPWRERLSALIARADAVVFLISPDSVLSSSVCDWELNETERMGKRLLPVVTRRAEDGKVPSRLSRLNWIFMDTSEALGTGLDTLAAALTRDISWIREHTRIGELAARWANARNKEEHALLRGKDIDDAELWISSRPPQSPETPEVTDGQRAFIRESRRAEQEQAQRAREQITRTAWFQRWFGRALAGVGVLLVAGIVGVIWQDIETTRREQSVFLNPIDRATGEQRYDRAMRYALVTYPAKGSWPWTPLSTALEGKLGGAAVMTRLLLRMRGHQDAVVFAGFSPDGARVLTASGDKTARVWDAATDEVIAVLAGHKGWVYSAAFSPDGTRVVTAAEDKTARVWDAATGREIAVLKGHCPSGQDYGAFGCSVLGAAFSPDGSRVVTASGDTTARVWDAATGEEIAVLKGHCPPDLDYELGCSVHSAVVSPNGTRIVTASDDNTARIWDAATGKEIASLAGHEDTVYSAAFSPDGTRVVTAAEDKTARIWDAATGKEIAVLKGHGAAVVRAVFSPDGTRIVTASSDYTARVWDAATGEEVAVLRGHEGGVTSAAFSPDGTRVVTASHDRTVRLWDGPTGKIAVLGGHDGTVRSAAFSQDGTRVITASIDGTARLWDAAAGAEIAVFRGHGDSVFSAEFSPDGTRIVTASHDKTARLWDAAAGAEIAVFKGHGGSVSSAEFSPDGTQIVTASGDKTVRLWDTATDKEIATFNGHEGEVTSAAFSSDGTRVITVGEKTARVWDAAAGKEISVFKGHGESVAFSSDGTRVITVGDKTARVWDAAAGKEIAVFKGHGESVTSAAFSPDGTRIVTASFDKTARVWDVATGREIAVLKGHGDVVSRAAFSPDGTRIVTASWDKIARIWDAATGREIAVLMGHEGAVLSAAFSPNGTRIVTASFDGTARVWDVAWASKIRGASLRDRVCAEKLIGAQEFTDAELNDPMLSGIDSDDEIARNPCLRRGPLHWEYYAQAAVRWGWWARKQWVGIVAPRSVPASAAP